MKIFHQSQFFIQFVRTILLVLVLYTAVAATTSSSSTSSLVKDFRGVNETHRRILHQPLYPASPPPSEETTPPSPPSPDSSDQPFFPETPTGPSSDQSSTPPPPTVSSSNGSFPYPTATQPNKPAKRVAIAISVGIVTLGMLSALAFFLYRYRARHSGDTRKLVGGGGDSHRVLEESRMPPQSSFLYIGTVDPSAQGRRPVMEVNGESEANGSPYHKLNSVKLSDRYRPSPELQPLPPLSREFKTTSSPAPISSSDEESHRAFYTPGSLSRASSEDSGHNVVGNNKSSVTSSVPHSKRTSPKARLSASSPDVVKTIIPSIKQPSPPPPPPENPQVELSQRGVGYVQQRPKLSLPPPPPNRMLLQSISKQQSPSKIEHTVPPPPPPPPPPPSLPLPTPRKVVNLETRNSFPPSQSMQKQQTERHNPKEYSWTKASKHVAKREDNTTNGTSSLDCLDSEDTEGGKPKLKALHWDKVRAISDRATVWDQLKSSSFHLNEDMMETLFGCNSTNPTPKESTKKLVLPLVEHENRILDPKKSQNIAILLRALNVTRDEVSEALLDGNPEGLGAELLETLVKMAPTKEEEIKVREYSGDVSALGSAERFLKTILDIPFAFKRVEAMLYRANFDTELKYLRKSFQALEDASEELKNSLLFLKLLEAVLKTGNRMNVGTNRGDARAFKLDTLLKLVDIKGTDGKTTLLHFVVQEIVRSEGLQAVSGLSRDLSNVKKAAGMDSDVLSSYVSKLEMGLEKVGLVLQYEKPNMQGKFFDSMKTFLREAEKEIQQIKVDERKALSLVKDATDYFHGDTTKEEAHPLRLFMIVRDFLSVLDNVCKEVGRMQDRSIAGSARSFKISSSASLPVLNRYNVRQDSSSDEESLSP